MLWIDEKGWDDPKKALRGMQKETGAARNRTGTNSATTSHLNHWTTAPDRLLVRQILTS